MRAVVGAQLGKNVGDVALDSRFANGKLVYAIAIVTANEVAKALSPDGQLVQSA